MSRYNNHLNFSNFGPTKTINKILVIKIAENNDTTIPSAKVNANPLMNDVAIKNRIAQIINELKF